MGKVLVDKDKILMDKVTGEENYCYWKSSGGQRNRMRKYCNGKSSGG
jgi:hypothetical protein